MCGPSRRGAGSARVPLASVVELVAPTAEQWARCEARIPLEPRDADLVAIRLTPALAERLAPEDTCAQWAMRLRDQIGGARFHLYQIVRNAVLQNARGTIHGKPGPGARVIWSETHRGEAGDALVLKLDPSVRRIGCREPNEPVTRVVRADAPATLSPGTFVLTAPGAAHVRFIRDELASVDACDVIRSAADVAQARGSAAMRAELARALSATDSLARSPW